MLWAAEANADRRWAAGQKAKVKRQKKEIVCQKSCARPALLRFFDLFLPNSDTFVDHLSRAARAGVLRDEGGDVNKSNRNFDFNR
jgi:hypothetical protein